MPTAIRTGLTALALLFSLGAAARAQPESSVSIFAIKADGTRGEREAPTFSPDLPERFRSDLGKLPYARFAQESSQTHRGPAGAPLRFSLPRGYAAEVTWRPVEGALVLAMTITKPAPPDRRDQTRVKVADLKVQLRDGQHYLIKCTSAFGAGQDLLLLVEARRPAAE